MKSNTKNTKILFLDPESGEGDVEHFYTANNSINPVGAMSVANYINNTRREIHFVQQRLQDNNKIIDEIVDFEPDVLAVSSYSYNFPNSLVISKAVQEKLPFKPITVFGGIHPTLVPKRVLEEGKDIIDYVVVGEGEITFEELLSQIEVGNISPEKIEGLAYTDSESNEIVVNNVRKRISNLDIIPTLSKDFILMDHKKESLAHIPVSNIVNAGISSARGCDHVCSFCTSPTVWKGGRIERKNVVEIVDEMEFLHKRYGTNYIMFTDEKFIGKDRGRFFALCEEMIKRNMKEKMRFSIFSTLRAVDENVLRYLSEAGCSYINYGVEAVDIDVLKKMHKGINILKDTRDIFIKTREANIFGAGLFMIGAPYDSLQSIEVLTNFVQYNADVMDKIRVAFYTPFAGTRSFDDALSNDQFMPHVVPDKDTINWNFFTTKVPTVLPPNIISEMGWDLLSKSEQTERVSKFLFQKKQEIFEKFYVNEKYFSNCRNRLEKDSELIPVFREWFDVMSQKSERFMEAIPPDIIKILYE